MRAENGKDSGGVGHGPQCTGAHHHPAVLVQPPYRRDLAPFFLPRVGREGLRANEP